VSLKRQTQVQRRGKLGRKTAGAWAGIHT